MLFGGGNQKETYMNSEHPQISVCVCTYKRPNRLLILLKSLADQTIGLSDFEVVVVDNDQMASARDVVAEFKKNNPEMNIRYDVEPMQGISYARNRTVNMATGELIAFIDDDEIAVCHWIEHLVACMQLHKADAVMGPVIATYSQGTPQWIIQSRFFERKRFPTGIELGWGDGHTGNALVKAFWAKKRQPQPFDIRLALSGGEDTDFFKWIESNGGKFTWCDSAEVSEDVPVDRQTLRFMLERSLISSATYWRPHYEQHSRLWSYCHASLGLAKAVYLAILGIVKLPFGLAGAAYAWSGGAKAFGRFAALIKVELVSYEKK